MGTGGSYAGSSKQKLNTKSSTESDISGVYDLLNQVIWTRHFLQQQVNNIHDNIIYQDNQSTIELDKNGRQLSSKRTRHINIRYYFITSRITNQEASMKLCPTLDMIGGYFAEAIQVSQFFHFRNIIIGIHGDDIPAYKASGRSFL